MIKYEELINGPSLFSDRFDFKLIQGNIISGSLATPGPKTIGIRPCPPGVAGTNTDYYVKIAGGTGTAEVVLVTGGTAVSGGDSGTLQFTTVNPHTGNWTITSATAGISEASWSLETGVGGTVQVPEGQFTLYAPVKRRINVPTWIVGAGQDATALYVATDFSLSAKGVFNWSPADNPFVPVYESGGISRLSVRFIQPDSTNVATYTHWPPAFYSSGAIRPVVSDVDVYAAWDVVKMDAASNPNTGGMFRNIRSSFFNRAFDMDICYDTVRIENFQGSSFGLTANQTTAFVNPASTAVTFYIGRVDDLKISNSTTYPAFCNFHTGADGQPPLISMQNVWGDQGGYVQSDGLVRILNLNLGGVLTAKASLAVTGGQLYVTNGFITNSVGQSAIQALMANGAAFNPTVYPPIVSFVNVQTNTLTSDTSPSVVCSTSGGFTGIVQCIFTAHTFIRTPDTNYPNFATLHVLAGTGDVRLTATGNTFQPKGTGTVTSIILDTDTKHSVIGNSGGGGLYSFTAGPNTVWAANNDFTSNVNQFQSPTRIKASLSPNTFVPLQTENYIASETGSNNAIAGALIDAANVAVPVAAGLKVTVKLAHTLQAGVNTFNLNATSAVNIKSARNPSNNIATAYAATGTVTLLYDGTQWVDVSQ